MFFLGLIFINFEGIGSRNRNENSDKKLNRNDNHIFTIPQSSKKFNQQTILVKFKPGISKVQRNTIAGLVNGKFKDKNNDGIDDRYSSILGGCLALLELEGMKSTDLATGVLRVLKEHPAVEYAEYNYRQYIDILPINKIPGDLYFNDQWGMNNTGQNGGTPDADIDAPEAWEITTGCSEVIVGIIDTGLDYNHEDLAANVWINPNEIPNNGVDDDGNGYIDDIHGINAIIESGDPMDDYSHGTHCSGILGAEGNNGKGIAGVNWTTKIIGMKFIGSNGYGWTSSAIECINYAIWLKRHGINIRVLNNSWGGGSYEQSLADAIKEANNAGILFIAAAINNASDNDIYPVYPACYPYVLAVASTDEKDGLSWFSNYGANTVHLGAPGSDIISTIPNNGYKLDNGTSMAAPHVSGAAALLLSLNDQLTTQEIKDNLMNYGDNIPALTGKTISGNRLNLYNSLSQVPAPNPDFRISITPVYQVIEQGETTFYTVNIQSLSGFSDPVTLRVSSNPDIGNIVNFNPNPVTPGSSSIMSVTTNENTTMTEYNIDISGSSGSILKSTSILLKVIPIGLVAVSYFNDASISIPDNNTAGVASTISIPDELKTWEVTVNVNITHTFIGDLVVKLVSPTGTEAILHNLSGGDAEDIHKTYRPFQFRNEKSLGNWKLVVSDCALYDEGKLDNWTLNISGLPENPLPPQADFSGVPTALPLGKSVKFTDRSANYPTSWMWTFNGGNPSTSTLRNPTVTYNTIGTHDVSLTVRNPKGSDTESKNNYITVIAFQPAPIADFTASGTSLIEGKQVTFTDKSTKSPTAWSWNFPGGNPSASNLQNPTVIYNTLGIYNVTLTVSNLGGTDTKTKNNYIHVNKLSKKIGLFDFSSINDHALVFDYNGDRIEDLFLYRPGSGVACVVRSNGNGTFDNIYYADGISANGIGLFDLRSKIDQVLTFDYNGDGNDDLLLYRPGSGAVGIVRSNGDGTFTSVYNVIDNGSDPPNGIGVYTLLSSKDRVLAFHLNGDSYDDLLLYRPSRGAISALTSRGDGTFRNFYSVIDNGTDIPNGICWFDLLSSNDKALAFNYNGNPIDELLFYRPGRGAISIVSPNQDGTFRDVYSVIDNGSAYPNGIGGYDLLSTKDIVLTCDYDGDDAKDLLIFRPGKGAVSVVHSNGDETFSSVYKVIDNGAALPNGLCGFDLLSSNDLALIFDYNGDGNDDIFFYRPGRGAVNIICSKGDGTFNSVYNVIDNGSATPNGIGNYNFLSLNDRALAYDYDGDGTDGLFLYRPGGGMVGIIPCKK